jgi:type IV pilus assembly protein PilA
MTCPRCQSSNAPEASFCASCGSTLPSSRVRRAPRRGLAIASLALGILSLPTLGLLLIGGLLGIVLGIVALTKANAQPTEYGGRGMAIAGIVCSAASFLAIPFVGILAAIAIPSLLRARVSANEAATIGDIRTIITWEMTYQAANGGFFDKPECLQAPGNCIPKYTGPPALLDGTLAHLQPKSGYRRSFFPGLTLPPEVAVEKGVSPTSLQSWAYVAAPISQNQTGVRAFCGDSTGRLCYTLGGPPEPVDGQCPRAGRDPAACQDLN